MFPELFRALVWLFGLALWFGKTGPLGSYLRERCASWRQMFDRSIKRRIFGDLRCLEFS